MTQRRHISGAFQFAKELGVEILISDATKHFAEETGKSYPVSSMFDFFDIFCEYQIYAKPMEFLALTEVDPNYPKEIEINDLFFSYRFRGRKKILRYVFVHEVAHLIDDFYFGRQHLHHSESWKRIMKFCHYPPVREICEYDPKVKQLCDDLIIKYYANYEASCLTCNTKRISIRRPHPRTRCPHCKGQIGNIREIHR